MGLYRRYVVPFMIHHAMASAQVARLRSEVIPAATGEVLEIGIGSGLNLPFYGGDARSVVGIDPSDGLLRRARKLAAGTPVDTTVVPGSAEALPFDTASFDSVLTTWTLCSIPDPSAALGEMRRVLRRTGSLVFVEHGRAPDGAVRRWQDRINPLWTRCSGGCNMNRDIFTLIRDAGFSIDHESTGHMLKGPKILTFHYRGIATPR